MRVSYIQIAKFQYVVVKNALEISHASPNINLASVFGNSNTHARARTHTYTV